MFLAHWLREFVNRFQTPPASRRSGAHPIHLGLMRLEDRRVLSATGGEVMLFSVGAPGATLPDVGEVQGSDIISYDGSRFQLFFDGSDVGLAGADIDAFAVMGENQFLMSFASSVTIEGVGTFLGSDIVLFQAESLGENTAGTFSLFLKGSDVGLPTSSLGNIDALDLLEDGTLVFSTAGNVTLPFEEGLVSIRDEDLVQIIPDADGNFANGTLQLYFRGGNVGLTFDSEDLNAVSIDGPQIRFSTMGSFFIESQNIGGSREDVLTFNATALGEDTAGAYVGITFDGSVVAGTTFSLDALDFATFAAPNNLPTAEDFSVELEEDTSAFVQLLGDDGEEDLDQPLNYVIVESPDFGVITNFDPSAGTFTYTPNVNFFGTDRIIYLVQETDANGVVFTSELATVTITVTAVNDAPIVQIAEPHVTGEQDSPVLIPGISVKDVEAAANHGQVVVMLLVENGVLSLPAPFLSLQFEGNGTSRVNITGTLADMNLLLSQGVTFQPDPGFSGLTALEVTIQDSTNPDESLSASGIVTIEILTAPEPPAPPEPPITFQDRIQQLLDGGSLKQGNANFLLNVIRHEGHQVLINTAIKNIEKWEQNGQIDSDVADELIEWLNSLGEESSTEGGAAIEPSSEVDAVFAAIGEGGPGKPVGRFRL
jgi:hypothetical protein